jgi:hypothetical protein
MRKSFPAICFKERNALTCVSNALASFRNALFDIGLMTINAKGTLFDLHERQSNIGDLPMCYAWDYLDSVLFELNLFGARYACG